MRTPAHRRRMSCVTFIGVIAMAAGAFADTYRWIEAEQPIATNFRTTAGNPYAPQNDDQRSKLSGGAWIGADGKRNAPAFAVYDVDIPQAGEYRFYARKFWKHGPYRVSFNNGPWIEVGPDVALLDHVELRQHICANWTRVGTVTLKEGRNRFRIESTTNEGAIAFDCFLITNGRFTPRGTMKPDEQMASDEPGWFAWDPAGDASDSPMNLRWMNEPIAGGNGRILSRGGQFVHEKTGKPVRFWGVNVGPDIVRLDDDHLNELAALLARRGVNHVRIHGAIYTQSGKDAGKLDEAQVANVIRAVRVLKQHGIYTTLSIYFPVWLTFDEIGGWAGYKSQTPFGLIFFDPKFQAMYRDWWRALLTTPDPVTGAALKDEPAILSLEMVNEDSLFFWTFTPHQNVPTPAMRQLESRFGEWLTKRHGSIKAATDQWRKEKVDGDDYANGMVGIPHLWRLFNPIDARAKETTRFLYDVQRSFYDETRDFLRNELGAKTLISASNWITASDEFLGPVERASYLSGDLIDRHAYYNGLHAGARAGYLISPGDTYADRSALRFETEKPDDKGTNPWNPAFDTADPNLPTMVSEIDWLEPNRYRTEAPLLCAAYGALQDLDAMTFFAVSGPTWQPTLQKFSVSTPVALGQYPAAAMIYRLGLVDTGPILFDGTLNLNDTLNLAGGLRGMGSRLAFIGRRQIRIDADANTERPSPPDVARFDDKDAKIVRSATGQLALDYGRGVLTIDAPAAKAFVGFLNTHKESVTLGPISIQSSMEYGAIAIVSLDALPIEQSKKLLVQVMSEQRNSGWKTAGDVTKTITDFGGAPILVRDLSGMIRFNNVGVWTIQPLDPDGRPAGDTQRAATSLTLQPTTPYYVLTRE